MESKEDKERTTQEEEKPSPTKSDEAPQADHGKIFGNFLEEHDVSAEEPEQAWEQDQTVPKAHESVTEKPDTTTETTQAHKTSEYFSQTSKGKEIIQPVGAERVELAAANVPSELVEQTPVNPPPDSTSNNSLEAQKDPVSDTNLPPIPTAIEPNRSRKLSQLMTLAYKQRKELNRADFQQLVKRRTAYYEKHTSVYDHTTFQLLARIKQTNEFMPSVIKYYHQLADIYKHFHQSSKKMSAFKFLLEPQDGKKPDARVNWSSDLNKGIKGMLELKDETSLKMKSLETELLENLLPALEKALHDYNKRLEHLHKLSDKQKDKYLESEKDLEKKVKKTTKLFSEENPEGKDRKDLLATELEVFMDFARSKKEMTEWGIALQNWWAEAITTEKALVGHIKKNVLNLLELYGQLHGLSDKKKHCQDYWKQLDVNLDVDKKYSLASILPLSQFDFFKMSMISLYDRSASDYTLEDWAKFGSLEAEDRIVGDRRSLLNPLILKRFQCEMLEGDKPKHHAIVASTVDEFLVFYDEAELTCYNRMQLKRLVNTRRSDYQVCVNEKIGGFIVDSWNREVLHFRSPDSAEEFMFYTENSPDVKKEYVVQ